MMILSSLNVPVFAEPEAEEAEPEVVAAPSEDPEILGDPAVEYTDGYFKFTPVEYDGVDGNFASITKYTYDTIQDVNIPDTLTHGITTYTVTEIGDEAFYSSNNGYLLVQGGTLTLNEHLIYIGKIAFNLCSDLTGVSLNDGLENIGEMAFYECYGMKGDLTIPHSVKTIGKNAFDGCSGLGKVLTIGKGVTSLGEKAFYNCKDFNKVANYSDQVLELSDLKGTSMENHTWRSKSTGDAITSVKRGTALRDDNNEETGDDPAAEGAKEPLSGNEAQKPETVDRGDFKITYYKTIAFYGKAKPNPEFFSGTEKMSVSYDGQSYEVSKIKVNKKKKLIQITGVDGLDKATVKQLKKATKGASGGLSFEVVPYKVQDADEVIPKTKGDGSVKSVKILIRDKYYKAKKTEWREENGSIVFDSANLTGSWKIQE